MIEALALDFQDPALGPHLAAAEEATLDALDFGVIGFDAAGVVRRYNAFESRAAGLSLERVVGNPLFTVVAPCMNNFLVARASRTPPPRARRWTSPSTTS